MHTSHTATNLAKVVVFWPPQDKVYQGSTHHAPLSLDGDGVQDPTRLKIANVAVYCMFWCDEYL